eukprot:gnl/MRDRNA2_/MRDRNA2_70290_c0_seq1.p1 gnl/MRDRNA2_/MRDRNA2_70290_c0~~gnl/MRDRNA2_/MRDRNA2_70290_c0_seq1.p1  ORF type:complete len:602 (-),score=101.11 gnl/MRDRNA2_/MRDRNA2_70290_c0_seq1:98-1723(-)
MAVCGEDLTQHSLLHRLRRALTDVIHPLEELVSSSGNCNGMPFQFFLKDFFETWESDQVSELSAELPHASDGLIFTPVLEPYKPGTMESLLKWKHASLNTVDFRLGCIARQQLDMKGAGRAMHVKLSSAIKGTDQHDGLWLAKHGDAYKQLMQDPKACDGKIAECRWIPTTKTFNPADRMRYTTEGDWEDGGWVLVKLRPDKNIPNDIRTVKRVIQSIDDDLAFEDLMREIATAKEVGTLKVAAECHSGVIEAPQLLALPAPEPAEVPQKVSRKLKTEGSETKAKRRKISHQKEDVRGSILTDDNGDNYEARANARPQRDAKRLSAGGGHQSAIAPKESESFNGAEPTMDGSPDHKALEEKDGQGHSNQHSALDDILAALPLSDEKSSISNPAELPLMQRPSFVSTTPRPKAAVSDVDTTPETGSMATDKSRSSGNAHNVSDRGRGRGRGRAVVAKGKRAPVTARAEDAVDASAGEGMSPTKRAGSLLRRKPTVRGQGKLRNDNSLDDDLAAFENFFQGDEGVGEQTGLGTRLSGSDSDGA